MLLLYFCENIEKVEFLLIFEFFWVEILREFVYEEMEDLDLKSLF